MSPKISILMGVYNCADTLEQAVRSIQQQTYSNWELIICDDGSLDNTYSKAVQLSKDDPRIIVLRNKINCGLNQTLNNCLKIARGKFIARMDGDDDCLPSRLEREIKFLEENTTYSIVSSPMILFDEKGEWGRTDYIEVPSAEDVVTGSPICHAPAMIRKEAIDAVGGYTVDPRMLRVEDVNLWIKLYAAGYKCYNISAPLYRMRNDQNALNRRKYRYRINSTYVRLQGCKSLHLSAICYIKALKPMIIGLIPARFRQYIRKKSMRSHS